MKIWLLTGLIVSICLHPIYAQSLGKLEGTVVDATTGETLPGVNITLQGTVLGTASDAQGQFSLERIPVADYNIQVTMIGYKRSILENISIRPDQTTNLTIELQETIIETPEVVVTANKRRQSIQDTPNSVGVLTRQDIEKKNRIYIDDVLQHTSGVHFIGTQVNIRGSSGFSYGAGSRILFLIDGVPVMPGDSGDIKWDMIPATQIERVEIIKGAGSALYGSNALGGVINIITKNAKAKPITHVRLSAGTYDNPVHPEWRWSNTLQYFSDIDVDHTRKIGRYSEVLLAAGRHQSKGYRQNTEYLRHNASFKWNYKPGGHHNLTLSTNWEGGERQSSLMWRNQRQALEVAPEALGDYVDSQKFGVNLFHQWIVAKNFALKNRASYFYNYWKNWYHDNITGSTAHKPGLELQGEWQVSEVNSVIVGSEASWDNVISGLVGTHNQYVLGAYVQNERQIINNVNLTMGLRYDYAWVDTGIQDSEWNPKIGLVWQVHSKMRIRASSGRGFRAPSMSERFSDSIYSGLRIIPNPDLQAESAWAHEFGFNYNPNSFIYLDVAAFLNDYWDLIEPEPNENQVVQFINVTRARIIGIETTLKMQPSPLMALDIGYTYMDPRDLQTRGTLAYRPRHLLTTGLTVMMGKVNLGADFRYISKLDVVKVYPQDDRVAQKVLNLRGMYTFGGYSLTLSVNNALNHNHTQMERTLEPLRHYVLTFSAAM